ncbi:TPA: IS481 family transposase [Klebsiella pneumoniae]|nr:IS481 family transposase [Klebsiella pneumoniae]
MLMQHIGVGYFGYYRATAYAMKHSLMPEIAKLRMKALNFWDKHGIRAAADAFDVSTRTLYWWRRLLRTGGPEALIPRSKAPLVRRSRHWHPDVLKEIRRLRTELPNLGKEQIFVRLKPWCEARHFTCPSTSTIGRIIAGAHDKMRMIPVRLSARGKARLIKKRSVKPRRPKQYRPVKTGELIGMDAIELRMGDLRRYIITMIDEHSDYALALAVPSLNSDITSHFFSKATKLFPVAIRQVVTDNGKEFLGNFDKTLQEASIKHIWTYPYTPKMNATCERFNRTLREQFIEFNELLLFEDLNLFNQRMAEYLVLYNSKRPHKSLELMTPVDYILRESKNCNMWWTHTSTIFLSICVVLTVDAEELSFPPTSISTQRLNDTQQVDGYSEELINPESHLAGPLDIATAVKSAVNWHPAINQQVSKLQEQVQKVDVAKAKYYPQVNAGMNNGYSNTYSDSGYSPSLVVSVSQMLYDFGKVSSSVRAADAAVAQQQAMVMLNIDQVAHDTAGAVVQLQGYQKLVKIAQAQVDSLKHIGDLIRQRNDAGATSLSDVVQTDTRVEGAQATLIQYQAALERWKATLATYLGLGSITSVTESVPQAMDAACAVSKIDYRTVPAVLAALAQATQAQAQVDNATAQMLPTISLEPQVTHYLNDNYANSAVLNKTQYSAWVKVEMPIYQGGALTASREAAQQTLSAANAGIRNAQLDASQKLSASRDEAVNLKQSIAIQRRQQLLGEQTRALYQDQYLQLGTRPLLDLLNVDQEIYQAQFNQVLTEAQLRNLELDCLFSTGKMRAVFALDNQRIQGVEIRP